uniref:HWE histidine kinase domain-containing protein n=1 Tax=Pararhizobium sp. IMCC3301 TaxID=3067904 RepID=UPI00274187F1|nr:HWE histidine kinase domain-containing protein [Pararhizobium sp. IMCC3301]
MDISNTEIRADNERLKRELAEAIAARAADARTAGAAKRHSNFLEAMLETMPIGVVIAQSPTGRILMGNERAVEMVRHPILESNDVDSYGEWISHHEDGTRVESHEYPLSQIIRDGKDYSALDVHYQRGDGSTFWMRIVGRPVLDDEGKRIGAAVALLDIDNERHLLSQQEILIGELNHRVKNAFTVVKSIVSQSLRGSEATSDVRDTIDARLEAYATAHSQLIGSRWDQALVADIAHDTIGRIAEGRISMEGPAVQLPSKNALALSMAFYELATNAVKHGSLSVPEGTVILTWKEVKGDKESLVVDWKELGGPPPVKVQSKGFGSKIIDRVLVAETSGSVLMEFPETGFTWRLEVPLMQES